MAQLSFTTNGYGPEMSIVDKINMKINKNLKIQLQDFSVSFTNSCWGCVWLQEGVGYGWKVCGCEYVWGCGNDMDGHTYCSLTLIYFLLNFI